MRPALYWPLAVVLMFLAVANPLFAFLIVGSALWMQRPRRDDGAKASSRVTRSWTIVALDSAHNTADPKM